MRSLSRGTSNSSDEREKEKARGMSRNRNKKHACIACKCVDCERMKKNSDGLNVNWCEEYNEEILVNFTEKGQQVMILDLGAPVSIAGEAWIKQYLENHGVKLRDLKSHECHQTFKFGPSRQYVSNTMIDLPVIVRRLDGKEEVLQVYTYLIDADVPFLCGKRELKDRWKSKIDTENNVLETTIYGKRKDFRIVGTGGNHVALEIEKRDLKDEQILFTNEGEDMNTFKTIRKVHEVTNHKSVEQLLKHYRRANLIGPNTVKLIKQVVRDCKICQKFGRSMIKPKIALPNASSFNEVVTLDLKQFGNKHVLRCIDSFTRFIQGKLLRNKKAETVLNAINECWNLPFGIPAVGFYADNGREFKNIKMDELISKLGISISYGPAYSPWSNGINERNYASCDLTIKKLMDDKKIGLTDILVKTAAWTHNTNVNKAGFSPLTLVTGKAVSIPGLTMGNEGSESLKDSEPMNKIMETIHKVTKEFRKAETKVKLKDCQGIRVRSYQHQGNYIAGNKVWYQYKDGNAWHGPAEVIYQKGNAIFIHSNGDVKKIAACKVKPYNLKERTEEENKNKNDEEKPPEINQDNNNLEN